MRFTLIFLFLFYIIAIKAQNSFSKELIFQGEDYITAFSSSPRMENDNVMSTAVSINANIPQNQFGLVFLSSSGDPIDFKIMASNNDHLQISYVFQYDKKYNWHLINTHAQLNDINGNVLFLGNFQNNEFRSFFFEKRISYNYPVLTNNNKAVYPHKMPQTNSPAPASGYTFIDLDSGTPLWSNYYICTEEYWAGHTPSNTISLPNDDIICLTNSQYNGRSSKLALHKINDLGQSTKSITLSNEGGRKQTFPFLEMGSDGKGNIYVPGYIVIDPDRYLEGKEPFIAKLDSNLNVLWAKQLHANNFYPVQFFIKTFPDGNTVFSYATHGDLPVIVGKISPEGELLWHKGYGYFSPRIGVAPDSSLLFFSERKYLENGSHTFANILVKTTSDGEIEDCPQFDACIELIDIDIQTEEVHWISEPAPMPVPVEITVSDGTFTTQDYCGTPPPPTADFMLPDTICQYECLVPDSTNNRYAHHVEWHITGENTDTIIADTTFTWCFEEAGTYFIEQEIWLLGCSEVYMHRLTVLSDDLTSPLGEDRTVCDELPVELIPASSRPLKSFLWDDGSQTESRLLTASGTYYLTATDGYCSIEDTVTLNVLQETIHPPFLDIPNDTLLCPDLLPLTLYPSSIYTDTFFLNEGTLPSNEINIYEAGDHSIWASIEGCLFEENIRVEIESCKVPVFLPNAFSPNDDGINDFLFLLGEDFKPVKIQVFDRWGGLIHTSDDNPVRWDGKAAGKEVDTGVYLITYTYFNIRNLREEVFSREVLLMR